MNKVLGALSTGLLSVAAPALGQEAQAEQASYVQYDTGVTAQQNHLNGILAPYGFPELLVDGISGPKTEQALCAGRLLTGMEVSRTDMLPGSDEEAALLSATTPTAPVETLDQQQLTGASRWVLVDQECQVLVAGEYNSLQFVWPISTGETPNNTRNGLNWATRYNPASHNNGWHNSTSFPASSSNPNGGNMYKPIYFDGGQAIHGAINVPTYPASHGCVRTNTANQDQLVEWAGLSQYSQDTYGNLGVLILTQGQY